MTKAIIYHSKEDETLHLSVLNFKRKCENMALKAITFFASSIYDPNEICALLNSAFSGVTCFGSTTAGEISNQQLASYTIVFIGLTLELIEDVKIEIVDSNVNDIQLALNSFSAYYNRALDNFENDKFVMLTYLDGNSKMEEHITNAISERINIHNIIGGSSGDDFKFSGTLVFANGTYYEHKSIMVLLKLKHPFFIEKIQSFTPTTTKFRVTRCDSNKRIIYELNGRPAVEIYAESIGVDKTNTNKLQNTFISNPFGELIDDNEIYVHSIKKIIDETALELYSGVEENFTFTLLQADDIVLNTTQRIDEILIREQNDVSLLLLFNCVLIYLGLQYNNQVEQFYNIFKNLPAAGFCTYGEVINNKFVNQTLTILGLK